MGRPPAGYRGRVVDTPPRPTEGHLAPMVSKNNAGSSPADARERARQIARPPGAPPQRTTLGLILASWPWCWPSC
ncbi:hypothetical protein QJS66_09320 [Kocuria rhizophila]|nr:hypothetical protein QJS66_09320 [Kocuria rhizophila]